MYHNRMSHSNIYHFCWEIVVFSWLIYLNWERSSLLIFVAVLYLGLYVKYFVLQMLPLNTNIPEAYACGQDQEQNFIQNLAMFLCTYLKEHSTLVEKDQLHEVLMKVSKWLFVMLYICIVSGGNFTATVVFWHIQYVNWVKTHAFVHDHWNIQFLDTFQKTFNLNTVYKFCIICLLITMNRLTGAVRKKILSFDQLPLVKPENL